MKKIITFLLLLVSAPLTCQNVCLNMIVKDEAKVITRCIDSVLPLIDSWVIVDTGSTDGTQEIIINHMKEKGLPGQLYERKWQNFEHNRNEALELAKPVAEYILFIDADEYFVYEPNFVKPQFNKDFYYIDILHGSSVYKRISLIKTSYDWRWKGILHEVLTPQPTMRSETLQGVRNTYTYDGVRSRDPQKYQKDAALLEEALLKEPNNSRYVFYLAQSYKDAGEHEKALKAYAKRALMGGWNEEVFYSYLQIAQLKEALNHPQNEIVAAYSNAFSSRSCRIEPLYQLTRYHNQQKEHEKAYQIGRLGMTLPSCKDILFTQPWMKEYGLPLETSVAAYWTERYEESKEILDDLLKNPSLPEHYRVCAERNLGFCNQKLLEKIVEKSPAQ